MLAVGMARKIRQSVTESLNVVQEQVEKTDAAIANEHSAPEIVEKEPWMTSDNAMRYSLGAMMRQPFVEVLLMSVIFFNMFVIIYETNQEAKCFPTYNRETLGKCPTSKIDWVEVTNLCLLIVYSLEALINIYVWRMHFFKKGMFLFDLFICIGGWLTLFFDAIINLSWFRILRCGRILKAAHLVNSIPELYMLFSGFFGSMKAMFYGTLILIALLGFFSIIIVQIIHPINASITYPECTSCGKRFRSIEDSMLTLFQQIVAGDSWGQISVPVIEESWFRGLLLPISQVVIGVGAMNLILAVVVDCAVQARENNKDEIVKQKKKEQVAHKRQLLNMLIKIDEDRSGTIDRQEIEHAMKSDTEFQTRLGLVGLEPDEVEDIVDAIEDKKKREISYLQFINSLDSIESADIRKMVVLLKMKLQVIQRDIEDRFEAQESMLKEQTAILRAVKVGLGVEVNEFFDVEQKRCSEERKSIGAIIKGALCRSDSMTSTDETAGNGSADDNQAGVDVVVHRPADDVVIKNGTLLQPADTVFHEDILTCQEKMVNETTLLRKSLADLDKCWDFAVQSAFHKTISALEVRQDEGSLFIAQQAVEQFRHLHRYSKRRRTKLLVDLTEELATDIESLVSHCKRFEILKERDGTMGPGRHVSSLRLFLDPAHNNGCNNSPNETFSQFQVAI